MTCLPFWRDWRCYSRRRTSYFVRSTWYRPCAATDANVNPRLDVKVPIWRTQGARKGGASVTRVLAAAGSEERAVTTSSPGRGPVVKVVKLRGRRRRPCSVNPRRGRPGACGALCWYEARSTKYHWVGLCRAMPWLSRSWYDCNCWAQRRDAVSSRHPVHHGRARQCEGAVMANEHEAAGLAGWLAGDVRPWFLWRPGSAIWAPALQLQRRAPSHGFGSSLLLQFARAADDDA